MAKHKYLIRYEHLEMGAPQTTLEAVLREKGVDFDELPINGDEYTSIGILETDKSLEPLDAIFKEIRLEGELRGGDIEVDELTKTVRYELQAG